jgi:hypothetical protein
MAIEKGKEKGSNMRSINISIRHDDDSVIAEAFDIELLINTDAESLDQANNLVVVEHPVETSSLDIQHLTAQWQDSLGPWITTNFG